MKVRQGFVSNSSSSSFLIYGAAIDKCDLIEMAKKMGALEKMKQKDIDWDKEHPDSSYQKYDADKDYEDCEDYEIIEWLQENFDLEIHRPSYYDSCYIGSSWSNVGDDETGLQFKNRVKKAFEEAGLTCELGTLEEAWMD